MKRSTIMQRLVLLTAIPVIALILFSGALIWESYARYQSAVQAKSIMEIAVATGDLIHPLQIERAASAGFIQSKGQKFADTLPGVRAKTDEKLAAYKHLLAGIDTRAMPGLQAAAAEAEAKLAELAGTRGQAGQFSISAAESSAYFSASIKKLLSVVSTSTKYNSDGAIGKRLLTYLVFLSAKENAGQERALSMPVFVLDKVESAQLLAILTRIHKQEAYLDLFLDSAAAPEQAALKAVLGGEAAREVQRMRGIMAERAAQGGFDVDSTVWFKRSTDRINGLYEVEQLVTKGIVSAADELLANSRTFLLATLALALLAVTFAVAMSAWVARGLSRSLKAVVDAAEYAVARDDFTHTIPEQGAHETVRTGQAINRLMEKFRTIISEATRSSQGIADASGALSISSDQVSHSSHAQSDAAATVAAAVEEVSASIGETTANARSTGEIVEQARAGTEMALAVMSETVKNVNGIAALIRASDANVGQLDERSKQIGGIIQVIREVADQTNLLALNAAIEAARAGEQGRGFAVVADEVRKLAERTSKATTEIAALIGDVQQHIGETVAGMHQANTQVAQSLDLVGRTEAALHRIGDDSRAAASNVQSIIDAIREQDVAVQQVAANIESIAQMAEENSAAAASNSATVAQLNNLSGALRESVARFKV